MLATKQDAASARSPKVSVIIPTKNRAEDLQRTVDTLLQQTHIIEQLIIIDQSSSASLLKGVSVRLEYIHNPGIAGASRARNEGMKLATGEIWLFLDDDVLLEPDFIQKLLATYGPGVTGVSGIVTNYSVPPLIRRAWAAIFQLGPYHDARQAIYYNAEKLAGGAPVRVSGFTGALMSFRADAVRGLWFDENLRGSEACPEDIDFCARLPRGSVLLITPQARLVHKRSPKGRTTVHWLGLQAQGSSYMRQRHWRRGFWNNACFTWLNVGYALAAVLSSVRRISAEPWRAWIHGAKQGRLLAKRKSEQGG
jgi:glycosyltransferase involved in cell wall biosynthesis